MITEQDITGTGYWSPAATTIPKMRAFPLNATAGIQGHIIISPDGWMNASLCHGERPPLSGDPTAHRRTRRRPAFCLRHLYFLRRALASEGNTFITQVEFALNPGWVGGEQIRGVELTPDGGMKLLLSREQPDGTVVNAWVQWSV